MDGLLERSQRAAADLSEALGINQGQPQVPLTAAPIGQPMGALGMAPGPQAQQPGLPSNLQHPSPLLSLPDFKSPPVAAALQAGQGVMGHPTMQAKPVGFARGGYAVFGDA